MTLRKLLGFLIAICGIALGAFLTGATAILLVGGVNVAATCYSRINLLVAAVLGTALGYGIYRLGRWIAR